MSGASQSQPGNRAARSACCNACDVTCCPSGACASTVGSSSKSITSTNPRSAMSHRPSPLNPGSALRSLWSSWCDPKAPNCWPRLHLLSLFEMYWAMASPPLRRDCGEAIDVSAFYGRESELVELERWMVDEHCRLVALLSRGGYGKTALSVKLTQQIERHFDVVIWRSLQNTPPLERLLADYLTFLSEQHTIDLPESTGERMTLLFAYLRTARCLLSLDNVETLVQERNRTATYRAGYEAYGQFFQRVGQTAHHSCLLLTSREQPKELAPLEGDHAPVRTMVVPGLEQEACRPSLQDRKLARTAGA